MRSRDGNRTFLRRFLFITLLSSLALNASEYLISYRYVVKDSALYNETLYVSKAMKKCDGKEQESIFLNTDKEKSLKKIITNNFEEFIYYIHKLGLHINHKDKTINLEHTSTSILTLKTTCFKVDINDNLAKITPLK